jgi:hypothetical protein
MNWLSRLFRREPDDTREVLAEAIADIREALDGCREVRLRCGALELELAAERRYTQQLTKLAMSHERELAEARGGAPTLRGLSARLALVEMRIMPDVADTAERATVQTLGGDG